MIKINSLTFQYPQTNRPVLENISLEIPPSTLTLVTGPTGSGKSTFLRCLNGLVPHFSGGSIDGKVRVFDHDPLVEGPERMAARVGFVFQEPESQFLFDIVEDEIVFALENAGMPRDQMQIRADQVIRQMGLEELRSRNIHEISGGEKQKVAIASALVNLPDVLILDEPTSQLDPTSANDFLTHLTRLKHELDLTIVVSEHRLERLLPFVDFIASITPNHTLQFGAPQEILPKMQHVPPIIKLAKELMVSPLPLRVEDFPNQERFTIHGEEIPQVEKPFRGQNPILETNGLSASFDQKQVLDQVDLQLYSGEILTLVGANGAGKTTLLRSILGLIPSKGQRYLFGEKMEPMDLEKVIQYIAYLPQDPNDLLFAETVLDELLFTLKNHKKDMTETDLTTFLSQFGLSAMQDRYPRDLSVGERQRTALAAITVHQPEILLLDEPTRGMDYNAKSELTKILKNWCAGGKSVLLVTHDVEFAACLADRVVIIENGKVRFTGSPKTAFSDFPEYRTQTAQLFPHTGWIKPEDCLPHLEI
jgi:energy-coupling factor transporter ATP-binding protein EcfA2